jgi:hypothetical protein
MERIDESNLPPETVKQGEYRWERTQIDDYNFQWVRPLRDHEYEWDISEVSLVGVNQPIRAVSLQLLDETWNVEGVETAGPDYHRPGFTELINSDLMYSTDSLEDATDKISAFIHQLS